MPRFISCGRLLFCIVPVLVSGTAPAGGAPITFAFAGTVSTVFDGLGALDNSVQAGGDFTGFYTFDSATPNTAAPIDEGAAGLYHHDLPPAGVQVRVGNFTFRSIDSAPDFDIIVNNEVGFAGADEYGFASRSNESLGLRTGAPIGRLEIDWLASTVRTDALESAALPALPPDLGLLGGGLSRIEGECTLCMAPAAFFRIEGTLDSLVLATLGDVNRDGCVNGLDTDPFVHVLVAGYFDLPADMNEDAAVNGLDIHPFVAAVAGGEAADGLAISEPSTLGLATLGIFGLVRRVWRRRSPPHCDPESRVTSGIAESKETCHEYRGMRTVAHPGHDAGGAAGDWGRGPVAGQARTPPRLLQHGRQPVD